MYVLMSVAYESDFTGGRYAVVLGVVLGGVAAMVVVESFTMCAYLKQTPQGPFFVTWQSFVSVVWLSMFTAPPPPPI